MSSMGISHVLPLSWLRTIGLWYSLIVLANAYHLASHLLFLIWYWCMHRGTQCSHCNGIVMSVLKDIYLIKVTSTLTVWVLCLYSFQCFRSDKLVLTLGLQQCHFKDSYQYLVVCHYIDFASKAVVIELFQSVDDAKGFSFYVGISGLHNGQAFACKCYRS